MPRSILSLYSATREKTAVYQWINQRNPSMSFIGRHEAGRRAAMVYQSKPTLAHGARQYACLGSDYFCIFDLTNSLTGTGLMASREEFADYWRHTKNLESGTGVDDFCRSMRNIHCYGLVIGQIEEACLGAARAAELEGNGKKANMYAVGALCAYVLLWPARLVNALLVGCVAAMGACYGAANAWVASKWPSSPKDSMGVIARGHHGKKMPLSLDDREIDIFTTRFDQFTADRASARDTLLAESATATPVTSQKQPDNPDRNHSMENKNPNDRFSGLPAEVIENVAKFLPPADLVSFALTSGRHRAVANRLLPIQRKLMPPSWVSEGTRTRFFFVGKNESKATGIALQDNRLPSSSSVGQRYPFGEDEVHLELVNSLLGEGAKELNRINDLGWPIYRDPSAPLWRFSICSADERLMLGICATANERLPALHWSSEYKSRILRQRAVKSVSSLIKLAEGKLKVDYINKNTLGLRATMAGLSGDQRLVDQLLADPMVRVSRKSAKYRERAGLFGKRHCGFGDRFFCFHPLDIIYGCALSQDRDDVVRRLIEQEPEFCSPSDFDLEAAIHHGSFKTVQLLLSKGVSIGSISVFRIYEDTLISSFRNSRDDSQRSEFWVEHLEAAERCLEICRLILKSQDKSIPVSDRDYLRLIYQEGKIRL